MMGARFLFVACVAYAGQAAISALAGNWPQVLHGVAGAILTAELGRRVRS